MPKHGDKAMGVCAVHYYVNNDSGNREVQWCDVCGEYICARCWVDLPKRALAMAKKKKQQIFS